MEKLKKFIRLPILDKLRVLKRKTKINFYPDYFRNSIYSKFIFILFFIGASYKLYKLNSNYVFNSSIDYKKFKIIYGVPRSGNNFLRHLLSSYLEQLYGLGNGNPKFSATGYTFYTNQTSIPCIKSFQSPSLRRGKLEINYNYFYHTHHPIRWAGAEGNRINMKLVRPIILIRNPVDSISS